MQKYNEIGDVYKDISLVWSNCRQYNLPDADVCREADRLEPLMDSELIKVGLFVAITKKEMALLLQQKLNLGVDL